MTDELTDNLCVLQDYLDDMLDRVQENTLSYQRFQKFEQELFKAPSLAEMIELILQQGKEYFELDIISICLLDEQQDLTKLFSKSHNTSQNSEIILLNNNDLLKRTFGHKIQAYLGSFNPEKYTVFFPDLKKIPASIALLPLNRHGKFLGSLNLGSFSAEHFASSTASDFVQHLGAVVSICLENQINYEFSGYSSN